MAENRCVNCDIFFDWEPTIVGRRLYCCAGCAEGGPCSCDYDNLPRQAGQSRLVPHVYVQRNIRLSHRVAPDKDLSGP